MEELDFQNKGTVLRFESIPKSKLLASFEAFWFTVFFRLFAVAQPEGESITIGMRVHVALPSTGLDQVLD